MKFKYCLFFLVCKLLIISTSIYCLHRNHILHKLAIAIRLHVNLPKCERVKKLFISALIKLYINNIQCFGLYNTRKKEHFLPGLIQGLILYFYIPTNFLYKILERSFYLILMNPLSEKSFQEELFIEFFMWLRLCYIYIKIPFANKTTILNSLYIKDNTFMPIKIMYITIWKLLYNQKSS